MAFYVLDENNNKIEALDREGVLNVIETAIANGSLANLVADAGFITKLKCCVSGKTNKMGFITQAQYNELVANGLVQNNTMYFIYDDNTAENIEEQINSFNETLNNFINGNAPVPKATSAEYAEHISSLTSVGKTKNSIPLAAIMEFDSYKEPTGKVYNAIQVTGKQMITSEATTVPITKAGLYVCTLSQTSTGGSVTYYTVMISIPSINSNCEASFGSYGTVNDPSWYGMGKVRYWQSNRYLDIYEENSTYSYKFKDCRLITEY